MARINEIMDLGGTGEASEEPIRPSHQRMQWQPGAASVPIKIKPQGTSRFDLPRPNASEMPVAANRGDLDALIARIRAEEQLPPHKKNAARIAGLKQQAMELMQQEESLWVQRQANRLLPRLEEDQGRGLASVLRAGRPAKS
jgi:hypothetical protein